LDQTQPSGRRGGLRSATWRRLARGGSTAGLLAGLAGCGSTGHFVERPPLDTGASQADARQAIAQLFAAKGPYRIKLCEADPATKACKKDSQSLSATGVGGLLFPIVLHLNGLRIKDQRPAPDGLAVDVAVESTADGIPPVCATGKGAVIARDDRTASLHVGGFYCNWMVVGNVVVDFDMSMDSIDPAQNAFTGYYRLVFHGTGNVSGSGYYKAVIVDAAAA
jgi:hypothetical protein